MTSILLKAIPEDIAKLILRVQFEKKTSKEIQSYNQSQTVIFMLKEYKALKEKSINNDI